MCARWLWWGLALAAGAGRILAADNADTSAVALPPFIVEELAKGPAWRYGELPGYEILSRCDDATTRKVVQVHHQLHELLAEILPPSLRLTLSVPRTLILYDEELQPAASQEVIRRMINQVPEPSGGVESFGPGRGGLRVSSAPRRYSFLPNLRLWDHDVVALFMIVRRDAFDNERLSLTKDYVNFLVKRRLPSLPPWFVVGFTAMYQDTQYDGWELEIGPLLWVSGLHHAALQKDPKAAPPVGPLLPFFQTQLPPRDAENSYDPLRLWQSQAALFVRWGLGADRSAHRDAFWKFVELSAARGASEELFAQCFGFSTAEAREKVAAYLPTAARKKLSFRLKSKFRPPELVLRDASDLHIARLKGDWERLEVPYVKGISAELAPKYLEQARRTLRRPYERGERDPRLLAILGLCECDAGNDAGAREFLEAAAAIGPIRPRANYELARLRLAAYRAELGPSGRLDAVQAAEVLKPLFAARADEPPLPQVYETIAEVWELAGPAPTRGHLAVIDEGVRLFPRQTELVVRAAALYLKHGYREQAGSLLEVAARLADNDATRDRIARLQEQLAAK